MSHSVVQLRLGSVTLASSIRCLLDNPLFADANKTTAGRQTTHVCTKTWSSSTPSCQTTFLRSCSTSTFIVMSLRPVIVSAGFIATIISTVLPLYEAREHLFRITKVRLGPVNAYCTELNVT